MARRERTGRGIGAALTGAALLAAALFTFAGSGSAASTATPTNTARPTISGTAQQGHTLHSSPGTWNPSANAYQYEWRRCDAAGDSCAAIAGASSSDYTPTSDDVGHALRVAVSASTDSGATWSAPATSNATSPVTSAGTTPANTSPPTISGTPQDNQTLTADKGSWSGTEPITYTYAWERCDANGNSCATIGSSGSTYKVTSTDIGHRIRVAVSATNASGSQTATSTPTSVVVAAGTGPVNTALPAIAGTPQDNQTLTATAGTWTGSGTIGYSYQWLRCDGNGNGCAAIGGSNAATYRVTSSDIGHRLRVTVTAKSQYGSGSATSAATAVVLAAGPPSAIVVPITSVTLPDRLTVDQVVFSPSTIGSRSLPVTGRFHVVDASGHSVSGALVYAVGVPANRVSVPPETVTGGDGWATVTFQPGRALPLRKGALLTVFVRARKSGESLLGGVSTRRLVSVRVRPA